MSFLFPLPNRILRRVSARSKSSIARPNSSAGFTLLETTVTVVVVGVVAAVLVTRIQTSKDRQRGVAIAKRLVAHVRYTQEMAILRGKATEFRVFSELNRYQCAWVGGSLLKDPLRGIDLDVYLGSGRADDLKITATGLSGGRVQFDPLGIPMSNGNPIDSEKLVVTLNNKFSVWIEPYSGRVYLKKEFNDD